MRTAVEYIDRITPDFATNYVRKLDRKEISEYDRVAVRLQPEPYDGEHDNVTVRVRAALFRVISGRRSPTNSECMSNVASDDDYEETEDVNYLMYA
jgi:hypothetical protein